MSDADAVLLVRIKPSVKREIHVFEGYAIKKAKGWYELPADVAKRAAREPLSDADPNGAKVFDVLGLEEATAVAEAEKVIEDPRGTIDAPVRARPMGEPPAPPPPPAEPPARRRTGTRSSG